jgi:hypothetical protein
LGDGHYTIFQAGVLGGYEFEVFDKPTIRLLNDHPVVYGAFIDYEDLYAKVEEFNKATKNLRSTDKRTVQERLNSADELYQEGRKNEGETGKRKLI